MMPKHWIRRLGIRRVIALAIITFVGDPASSSDSRTSQVMRKPAAFMLNVLRKIPRPWDVNGYRLYLDQHDTLGLTVRETWEPNETRLTIGKVRQGNVFVDIGANIGYYTILASRLVGKSGKVFAFEPEPSNFEILAKNVELNKCDNVVLENKAVALKSGKLELFLFPNSSGGHKSFLFDGEFKRSIEIAAISIDEFFEHIDTPVSYTHLTLPTKRIV